MITSSVDRLFESDAEVFMSNNFTDFQVSFSLFLYANSHLVSCRDYNEMSTIFLFAQSKPLASIEEITSKSPEAILSKYPIIQIAAEIVDKLIKIRFRVTQKLNITISLYLHN